MGYQVAIKGDSGDPDTIITWIPGNEPVVEALKPTDSLAQHGFFLKTVHLKRIPLN